MAVGNRKREDMGMKRFYYDVFDQFIIIPAFGFSWNGNKIRFVFTWLFFSFAIVICEKKKRG